MIDSTSQIYLAQILWASFSQSTIFKLVYCGCRDDFLNFYLHFFFFKFEKQKLQGWKLCLANTDLALAV